MLGKSPAWQDTDGACSGYLVECDNARLLLDCGNGVFGKLRHFCDYIDVQYVLITHLHADHLLDLVPYSYALVYAPRQQPVPVAGWPGTDEPARPYLYAPPGGPEMFRRMTGSWGAEGLIETAFQVREYDGLETLSVGPFTVRFQEVPHFVPTWAVELTAPGSGRLTFSADCSPNAELVEFAAGTDLLLIEATLPRPERTGERGHLTPSEAGEHGRRAGAQRLVLTHFSDELDADWALAEARRAFGGDVGLAGFGATYDV